MPNWMKESWGFMGRDLTDSGELPEELRDIVTDFRKRKIAVSRPSEITPEEFVFCTYLYDIVTSKKRKGSDK